MQVSTWKDTVTYKQTQLCQPHFTQSNQHHCQIA